LREVGRKVAAGTRRVITNDSDLAARAEKALEVLEGLGGAPRLEKEDGKVIIRSASCPFATAVKVHPEVCRVAETLVAQLTGGRVRERCNKIDVPSRCLFEITGKRRR
jgi:predicted ArsR family transcriptional regulator